MGTGGNYTFEPRRPREEEPYKIIKDTDIQYTKSWKTTANVKQGDTYQSMDKYFNKISSDANKFRKQVYKNMNKGQKRKTQKVPKGPNF